MNDKKHDDCCAHDDCRTGKRNRYFKGKNMTANDFNLEQHYGIERRRLLNRAIHGWGVAYGFELCVENGKLKCGPGLALDKHGRELLRVESGIIPDHRIKLCDAYDLKELAENQSGVIATTESRERQQLADTEFSHQEISGERTIRCLLSAHYAERRVDEFPVGDSCGCGETEWNHVSETIVFSLKSLPREGHCPDSGSCCQPCECDCHEHHKIGLEGEEVHHANAKRDRGPHDCLCRWLASKAETIPDVADGLSMWKGLNDICVAVHDPVPLACVTVTLDQCGHPRFISIVDSCAPRRLIKTNDLLFDLIRGCDLTRIDEISWAHWHRKLTRDHMVPWEEFERMIFPEATRTLGKQVENRAPVQTGFWIHFSRLVDVETLSVDCITMTVLAPEDEGGWIEVRRVPIIRLEPHGETGFTDRLNICVDSGWCHDEVLGHKSIFHRSKVRVEIEVRGDLILDCHGQAVDANAVGNRPAPTGNGTPGGTFISSFRLAPKRETKIVTDTD